jgi:hypothetical protein
VGAGDLLLPPRLLLSGMGRALVEETGAGRVGGGGQIKGSRMGREGEECKSAAEKRKQMTSD